LNVEWHVSHLPVTVISRPLGEACQGEFPNEVMHFDFLFMESFVDVYILVIEEYFLEFCELTVRKTANSPVGTHTLFAWAERCPKDVPRISQVPRLRPRLPLRVVQLPCEWHKFWVCPVPSSTNSTCYLAQQHSQCSQLGSPSRGPKFPLRIWPPARRLASSRATEPKLR
jgi:hypothetical protein